MQSRGPLDHGSKQMVAITVAELNFVEKVEVTDDGFWSLVLL